MVSINYNGRTGNQLFQYVAAYIFAKKFNLKISSDIVENNFDLPSLENGIVGDIKVIVNVKNTTKLERRGLDLYYTQSITLKEALCGFTIEIEYLQNKKFKIVNNDFIITPQYKKVVDNGGMKRDRNQGQFIITFNIIFPELSPAKIEKLKEIL